MEEMKKIQSKPKTLKDIWNETETFNIKYTFVEVHTLRRGDFEKIRNTAKEWIKELKKQKDLHAEFISNGIGEHPIFEYPEGFVGLENGYTYPFGYDDVIFWIEKFFNLKKHEENPKRTQTTKKAL